MYRHKKSPQRGQVAASSKEPTAASYGIAKIDILFHTTK
nr:MAG TPA: hypothetical protein [Caudoviricetes sp.]